MKQRKQPIQLIRLYHSVGNSDFNFRQKNKIFRTKFTNHEWFIFFLVNFWALEVLKVWMNRVCVVGIILTSSQSDWTDCSCLPSSRSCWVAERQRAESWFFNHLLFPDIDFEGSQKLMLACMPLTKVRPSM